MGGRVIDIHANQGWQDTGFALPAHQADTGWILRSEGAWCFNTGARDFATRDANARKPNDTRFFDAATSGRTEYPYHGEGGQVGQLIGRWGTSGQPFVVGTHANLEDTGHAGGGTLWLRINDDDKGLRDNDGHLTVTIATYDRTRRTQWNTVEKRWEYSDDHSPVR
ncbi:hypothetical protein [Actinomadura macrotermitis]|uniref:Uncharacterized protein n=1 Tax=Actinomadura macrotermitis TaxID=2585200 RepID=A0A7K0BRA2_9ACTN|nr:hypothetical protein [Actinomadura macrotermitis]MQY03254.1 hypothetical protein [Actinomadura macrotermitis]